MSRVIPSTTPLRTFKDHTSAICVVSVFPDRRRMVTGSSDKTVRLWDLRTGAVLKKMEGHRDEVFRLAVSRDGQIIASGDKSGVVMIWHGETGEPLTQHIKAHFNMILSLDFSPDGTVLATGSADGTIKLWNTKTLKPQGNPMQCNSGSVYCDRYSPSGKLLAIATANNIGIYDSGTRKRVANFKGHTGANMSLAWTPDGTHLISGGGTMDPTIREWDASTWQQVGNPWTGHTGYIRSIVIHPAGTLIASASDDHRVRLWRLSDRQTIAIFQHSGRAACVSFSMDGKHIFSGGADKMISEWEVPKVALPEDPPREPESKILPINTSARNACIAGDLSTAEEIFTQEISIDASNYTSYANRSFVMARKRDWDHALDDAIKSLAIQPSLTGCISKGIILCGKGQIWDARTAFDIAFMFTNEDSKTNHFLLLVKAIALFSADQHEEAMQLIQQLAASCPNHDTLACRVVEAYFHVQLGIDALNGSRHDEAVGHFTTAVNSGAFSPASDINYIYEDLVVLFGWDVNSEWKNAHQNRCDALCRAGSLEEALESYQYMMDILDEDTKARCLDWSNGFKKECSTLSLANGDTALAASDYNRAISSYSLAIDLNSASETIFAKRSTARSGIFLWDDALLDAEKVIELDHYSHVAYELKHAALHGAQRYDEAIEAFEMMLSKLDSAPNIHIRKLREQYLSPSDAERAIRKVIDVQLNNAPLRLLNTDTGLLCDRDAQISAFKKSKEYNELLWSIMKHPDLAKERPREAVTTYFRWAMLSHRWEGTEPRLRDIKDKDVYELSGTGGLIKLQSFCEVACEAEYRWAWVDSCCIDQDNPVELQTSIDSMFAWYRHSSLTAVYLSDVPPSSTSGALAKSAWNTRGWTIPEFLAPKVIRFYQQDWTPYLGDESPNHKNSVMIMNELEVATGIDSRALAAFKPGMRDIREKLQWASKRFTTRPEDIAYSFFGILDVRLPIHYGENRQNALGRLLQEIVTQSGDITALDWVGEPSTFNSCLPADISSYAALPCALPSLSEDEIQTGVSSLRETVAVDLALRLYDQLDNMSAPRFANCRLQLPCIAFRVTELRRRGRAHDAPFTYGVKADGLRDLQITTQETLIQFSRARPSRQTFFLVRPWDCRPLEQPDPAEQPAFADDDDAESLGDWSEPESPLGDSPGGSPVEQELGDSESYIRALRSMVRLGQPFGAFLLVQQHGGEYKRIASDHDIIARVTDVASVHKIMGGVRTLEIL
ncbi:hypothetical protein DFH29DRAFT_427026 [Suillus ampliporus]|nr:hypothetical protein DFH29DRAFT_427026 [Suillus ampliporus]